MPTVTLDDICRLVGLHLGRDDVREADRIVEDLGAESFDVLNVVSAIEERYEIVLEDEDAAFVETVGDLHALVVRKRGG